jgi:hypothetical protein
MIRKLAVFSIFSIAPALAFAQTSAPAAAPSASPVSDAVRGGLARYAKNMSAAADAMPADKFSFKPTADQISFGHLTVHIAESNFRFCSAVSGVAAPEAAKLADTDPKDKLVAAVKASFAFCDSSLAKVDDSHLADSIPLFPNRSFTRAGVMFILVGSWADHYAAQSLYLRLNGVLPPTAQPASH